MAELKLDLGDLNTIPPEQDAGYSPPTLSMASFDTRPQEDQNRVALRFDEEPVFSRPRPTELRLRQPSKHPSAITALHVTKENAGKVVLQGVLILIITGFLIIGLSGDFEDPFDNIDAFFVSASELFFEPSEEPLEKTPSLASVREAGTHKSKAQNGASEKPLKQVSPIISETVAEKVDSLSQNTSAIHSSQSSRVVEGLVSDDAFANPYWYLPNTLQEMGDNPYRPMVSHAKDEIYRAGIAHVYNYQAYKAVRQIRLGGAMGSEAILSQALGHKRFWVRMEALLALAELGYPLDIETVSRTLEGARPSLVKNYFKRFGVKPTEGELYIAKQAIRLVDARGRVEILKALSKVGWRKHRMYLVAASLDPAPMVKQWAQNELDRHPISGRNLADYRKTIIEEFNLAKNPQKIQRKELSIVNFNSKLQQSTLRSPKQRSATLELYQDLGTQESATSSKDTLQFEVIQETFDDGFDAINPRSESPKDPKAK